VLQRELQARLGRQDGALRQMIDRVKRVDLEPTAVRIALLRTKAPRSATIDSEGDPLDPTVAIAVLPIRCRLRGGRTSMTGGSEARGSRRVRRDPVLVKGLQQAHRIMAALGWSKADGSVLDAATMKAPENAYERKLCRLAFLAPDIQKSILDGRQSEGMTLDALLRERIPLSWAAQRDHFCLG
jgi:site-specific DNA recombinase